MDETSQDTAVLDMDFEEPYTSLVLEEGQDQIFAELLGDFKAALAASTGSEQDRLDSVEKLILLDEFINAVAEDRGIERSETIEILFNTQATSETSTITDYLDNIADHELDALQEAHRHGRSAVLERIEGGGAQIIDQDRVFVQTAPERASIEEGDGHGDHKINEYAPKFTEVIAALLSSEIEGEQIYYDDLVIHQGSVDPDMVRNRPYDVIQIPKLDKEIAVCEIIGEVILVSPQIRGPEVYEKYKKHELEGAFGMQRLVYRDGWQDRLVEALNGNLPENRTKVDVEVFAKKQSSAKMPLSPEIVGLALLKYAVENDSKMASIITKEPVPGLEDESWSAANTAGHQGLRNIPKGMTIAAIKRYYGWSDENNRPNKDKIAEDIAHFEDTGELPEPVMSIEDAIKVKEKPSKLSVEIVGLALLKYAAEHDGKMATQQTKDPVPGMEDESWRALEKAGESNSRNMPEGMTLPAIKRYYGWSDENNRPNKDKIAADIAHFEDTGELPEPVMSIEDAIKVKEKPNLSLEIVGLALLKYAAEHDGKMAAESTKDPVPDMENENWKALDTAGRLGNRNIPEEMAMPAIKRYYGWSDENNRPNKDKIAADIAHFEDTGELPEPAMSIEDAIKVKEKPNLSLEIVGLALLKYAAEHDGKMARAKLKDPVPGMEDESWMAFEVAGRIGHRNMPEGMSLAAIKRYYGWSDENNRPNKDKIAADIAHFEDTGELPEPVMSMEEAIHGKAEPEYDDLEP